MAIPKYDDLMVPMLDALRDRQVKSTHELAGVLAQRFRLSNEERTSLLPSGGQTYMVNRSGWAGFHLQQAGLVTRPRRAHWQITDAGLRFLETRPEKLNRQLLMQFSSFAEFIQKSTSGKKAITPAGAPANSEEESLSPEEMIESAHETITWRRCGKWIHSASNTSCWMCSLPWATAVHGKRLRR
jgi:restriction system protein